MKTPRRAMNGVACLLVVLGGINGINAQLPSHHHGGSFNVSFSSLLHDGVLAHMFECPKFANYIRSKNNNISKARSLLRNCMRKYLQTAEWPCSYVSTTTSLYTYQRNFGVFLSASKAGCTYIRDGWTNRRLHNCSVSDDVFLKYAREVGDKLERVKEKMDSGNHVATSCVRVCKDDILKYWVRNSSIRCCLDLPRAIRLRSKLEPARWLKHNQVQTRFALNESIGLFCRLHSHCDIWASLVSDLFLELTGRALPVERF